MKGCTFLGAASTGHICYPPTNLVGSSKNIYVNLSLAGRVGDLFVPHSCTGSDPPPPHLVRAISQGPLNVYFNMRPPGRAGDVISCGDTIAVGSLNVFAGAF